jgi:hypothetical protein
MKSGFSFMTRLHAEVIRDGRPVKSKFVMSAKDRFFGGVRGEQSLIDLGSGLVTNVGVMGMVGEWNYANPSAAVNTILALANYHITGTNATGAAATDITLGTYDSNGAATGVQSSVYAGYGTAQKYQTVATQNYTGTEAVTEWGLITSSTVSSTTGTPLTAVTATTATVTGTPLTASSTTVAGQQAHIIRTTTTAVWGLIISNTTSVLSLANNGTTGWWTVAGGIAGSTPGSTEAYTLYPVLWDHKVFSAINVVNGDSIQFTYDLSINSGG